ncbi:hypothetical protein PICMEDRAFT_15497 [Pichia membranifaciens NRRL Y-2026]|uniref:Uncharacterized protein n=1 Tax=Pichia membranifaciens NRRL Y-2026 TaxID=763406 RepID=A0A1E3NN87_9ASCO|nr:hypothetical protein PICMEDRAFT_15497 [Pichia membranifaciens NRRL Y-2026]ODQ47567.1 hypothetical protein PICMEDRAFT_15497 [Pichia membranifaciens NRRL Y-2026]
MVTVIESSSAVCTHVGELRDSNFQLFSCLNNYTNTQEGRHCNAGICPVLALFFNS